MVAVLVIPDGAAEPRHGDAPTALERAATPALDRLAAAGTTRRVRVTPAGLPAGSETGIPTLLGVVLEAPVGRGPLVAAARDVEVPAGARAWRIDGPRGGGDRTAELAVALPGHDVVHLRGFRHLAVGPAAPVVPAPFVVWPAGADLPRLLDDRTVVVAAPGAAAGIGRLLGATVVTPAGTTGDGRTDWRAKRLAALAAIDAGAARVVVHAGAPDEAAHDLDPDAKAAALEAIDRELIGPLWDAVRAAGGSLSVCPDHGTDPWTGEHDAGDVDAFIAATPGATAPALPWVIRQAVPA